MDSSKALELQAPTRYKERIVLFWQSERECFVANKKHPLSGGVFYSGSPNGNRTRVTGMRIRCPNR